MFFFVFLFTFPYINIYPLSLDKRIDGMGAIRNFTLTNTTNKTVKYMIDIEKTPENDMSSWTEIYPKTLSLKPGAKGEIKMYIRSPKEAKMGEYSTILNIKELEVPIERKVRKKVNVFTNLKIKLYGYVGKLDSSISLIDFKVNKNDFKLSGTIKNESLRRVSLEVVIADFKEKNPVLLAEFKLKKGEEMDLSTLNILLKRNNKEIDFSKLTHVYIYEKGSGKFLKREKMGS
ncbi:MAG: hypothetical protein ACRDAH_14955 [Cetobacterium sp.]